MSAAKSVTLPYQFRWTGTPHIAWVDLYNNQVMVEVAVMDIDLNNGDLFFIRTDHLDAIDKRRLLKIIQKRDSDKYKLWDLMSQVTLQNGVNSLEFFHQMVKVRTATGQIFSPNSGKRGATLTSLTAPSQRAQSAAPSPQHARAQEQEYNAPRAGRPPKGT